MRSGVSPSARTGAWFALVLLLAALVAACGGSGGDKTFEGDGYSFTYPGDWEEREGSGAAQVGNSISSVRFGPSRGANGLTLSVYRLEFAITEDNVDSFEAEVAAATEQIFRQSRGRVTEGPTRVTIADHPGFSAVGTAMTPGGTRVTSRANLIFDGTTEYFLNCQFTSDQAEEMQQGCRKVLDSFRIG